MKEIAKTKKDLQNEIIKMNKGTLYLENLPENGLSFEEFEELLKKYLSMNETDWSNGSLSGCVFGAEDNLTELTTYVHRKFAWSNPVIEIITDYIVNPLNKNYDYLSCTKMHFQRCAKWKQRS